ncbi:MAG: hypothetical protein SV775_10930 [Thermodesulfobacteriota bacterium]|nr:hypothetical protein [Thermodesulfobacteriota bacterium]
MHKFIIGIIIGSLLLFNNVLAQRSWAQWEGGKGPYGGDRKQILVDPHNSSLLYTDSVVDSGVWVSKDAGNSWHQSSIARGNSFLGVIDRNGQTRVIAGLNGSENGLFISNDQGETWQEISYFSDMPVVALKTDPNRQNRLIVVTQEPTSFFSVFHFSETYGDNWQGLPFPLLTTFKQSEGSADIAFHPSDTHLLYFGLNIHATCNQTQCLQAVTTIHKWDVYMNEISTIYQGETEELLSMLDADIINGTLVLYASFERREGSAFIRSIDEGGTWENLYLRTHSQEGNFIKVVQQPHIPGFFIHPEDHSLILGVWDSANPSDDRGLYMSYNGRKWFQVTNTTPTTLQYLKREIHLDPRNPDVLYGGMALEGVQRSIDRGLTWTVLNTGLTDINIFGVEVDPSDPMKIYAVAQNVIFKNLDGLSSDVWEMYIIDLGFLTANLRGGIAIDAYAPDTILVGAGEWQGTVDRNGGIYKSVDGGVTWTAVLKQGNPQITEMKFGKGTLSSVVSATAVRNNKSQSDSGRGVYVSYDSGGSWTSVYNLSDMNDLDLYPASSCTQIAVGAAPQGSSAKGVLLLTTDCWQTYIPAYVNDSILTSVSLLPVTMTDKKYYAFVGTAIGDVMRFDPATGQWATVLSIREVSGGNSSTAVVSANPSYPNEVYASTYGGGIYRSLQYGDTGTWTDFSEGLASSQLDIFDISFSPDGNTIFISSLGGLALYQLH